MKQRIITCSLQDDFIGRLCDHITRSCPAGSCDLSRLTVVFGGRRPALFVKRELARRLGHAYRPPRFFSIDEFIEYLVRARSRLRPIADLDASYAVYRLASQIAPEVLKARESFAVFLPWAREIRAFIDQLDLEDIPPESLENIQLKADIGYDVPESINRLLSSIIRIRGAYHEYLHRHNRFSRGFLYLKAAAECDPDALKDCDRVFFCGFFYLHRTEERIMKAFHDAGRASLFFQGDESDWSVLARNARAFGGEITSGKQSQRPQSVSIQAGFDVHSEVCLVREELKKIPDYRSTVVVVPQPENVMPLLTEVSSCTEEYNVSMGYSLQRSSLFALFRDLFRAQESRRDGAYYARDYLAVLSHPLIKNLRFLPQSAMSRVLVHKIEEILTGMEATGLGGSLFISLDEIEKSPQVYDLTLQTMGGMGLEVERSALREAVRFAHRILFRGWEQVTDFNRFAAMLELFLDTLAEKSSLGGFPLNVKMARQLYAVCDELKDASFGGERFGREEIFRVFEQKLENETVRFAGSPLKGLQILGLLETRSLHFEHVVVMDVNEASLPNLKIYEPLIPREVMISLGLNRLEKEEEIQRYQFMRLIAGARTVSLIYQQRPDKEKSRFLEELIWEEQKQAKRLDAVSISQAAFAVSVLPERLKVPKDDETLAHLKQMKFSSSSINTYLDCPLRFYYQYVLGLREKEDIPDELEGRDIGSFIHGLLEQAFMPFLHRAPVIDETFKREFRRLRDQLFEHQLARKMKSDAFLVKAVIDFRLERVLENEARRPVAEVLGLEKEFEGRVRAGRHVIQCRAFIDRIDRMRDGTVLILDYKTGMTNALPGTDPRRIEERGFARRNLRRSIKSFQLPLYLCLVEQYAQFGAKRTNAALYSIRDVSTDFGLSALFRKEEHFARKTQVMETYLAALGSLLDELFDPGVPFEADRGDEHICGLCPFFYLCR
ncbi:MAG: PD-(D/E)XK nuclease family protein [Candidatus Omnitrophica bacterium]|nr:PD-(D/E)XK nuclease family protein [Candidatus Omnitrophota bacterium]